MLPTIEQIESMEAGKPLDGLIAEYIMGWIWVRHHPVQVAIPGYPGNNGRFLIAPDYYETVKDAPYFVLADMDCELSPSWANDTPNYSTDIAAAFEVVETLRPTHHFALISRGRLDGKSQHEPGWQAELAEYGIPRLFVSIAPDSPLAICRVALKAKTYPT